MFSEESYSIDIEKLVKKEDGGGGRGSSSRETLHGSANGNSNHIPQRWNRFFESDYIYTHAYVNKDVVNLFDTLTYVNKYAEHFKGT